MDHVEQFHNITTGMADLYAKKNHDYGNSFDETLNEFGLVAAATRLSDKFNRFKSLLKNKSQVKDERLEDTLLDMANYAIMTVIWMTDHHDLSSNE